MFLRVLRALRGMISLSMLLNDPGMLYCDEPHAKQHKVRHPRAGGGPELAGITGFPPARE